MPDIVKRLRDLQTVFTGANFSKAYHRLGDEMGAAADEIERLRKTLREIEDSSSVMLKALKELTDEAFVNMAGGKGHLIDNVVALQSSLEVGAKEKK